MFREENSKWVTKLISTLLGGVHLNKQPLSGSNEGAMERPSKAVWLGKVVAPDEAAAMEKAAAEFKLRFHALMPACTSRL
jgi:hypothetical protein